MFVYRTWISAACRRSFRQTKYPSVSTCSAYIADRLCITSCNIHDLATFAHYFTILSMFYKSCIQSDLTFSFICWFGNVSQKDKNNLQRIVNISSKVSGVTQSTLTALYERLAVNKATKILADDTHILHGEYILLPSSRRFRTTTCKTNRKQLSFIPMSIRLLNDTSLRHSF